MAYPQLGLDPRLGSLDAVVDGRRTVSVPGNGVAATSTVVDGKRRLEVARSVVWSRGDKQAPGVFKLIRVRVSWDAPIAGSVELSGASGPDESPVTCVRGWVDGPSTVLSGTINTYLAVATATVAGAAEVEVGSGPGAAIRSGDSLMVIQMTGPGAGTFEYAVAGSSSESGRLVLSGAGPGGGLMHAYGVDGVAQIVRVPTVGTATLSSDVVAPAWNGSTGAVVALDVVGSVNGPGSIRADAVGFGEPSASGDRPDRLRPGGGAFGRGGGIVAVRGTEDGSLAVNVSANGAPGTGAGGGSVAISSLRPTRDVAANGANSVRSAGGSGGLIATTVAPNSVSVLGGTGRPNGEVGRVVTGWASGATDGLPPGVGCLPAVEVTKTVEQTRVQTTAGATAVWTIDIKNAPGRGTATGVEVTDTFAADVTLASTKSVSTSGGARRTAVRDPAAGDRAPRWGSFEIPPGGGVTIVVVGAVRPGAMGAVGNGAVLSFGSQVGPLRAGLPLDAVGADRVQLSPFTCDDPSTDAGLVGNTYFPIVGAPSPGARQIDLGPGFNGPPLTVGNQVLVMQMDGPRAGDMEYALVTGLVGASIQIDGRGPAGGLINGYGRDGAAQVVRVPTLSSLLVDRGISAPAWNGRVGGVLAIDVAGPLRMANGSMDVTAGGRRAAPSGAGGTASAARAPTGSGDGPGGGAVVVRAVTVGGTGVIATDGAGNSGGGSVVFAAMGGDPTGIDVQASGRGGAGAVLFSGTPRRIANAGPGRAAVRTDLKIDELPGMALGSTCRPAGARP